MHTALRAALQRQSKVLVFAVSVALGLSLAMSLVQPAFAAPATAAVAAPDWRSGFSDIADKVGPSVVYIVSEKTVERPSMPDFEDFFDFGPFGGPSPSPSPRPSPRTQPQPEKMKASGSGIIIRQDGYILTNNHVVAGADRVDVTLADGRTFKGKVTTDEVTDLALVKIDAKNLPAAQFADSDNVKVGQWAIAMGSPFGFKNTMTVGVVSAIRTRIDPNDPTSPMVPESIQTDASINFGNSGGPLLDIDGKIMGINFLIYSRTQGNVGIGFAIPSNTAKFVVDQLIAKGKVTRGRLGVEMQDLTPTLSESLGVTEGAVVTNVMKGSPAEKAKLQVKDVITKVNGKPIKTGSDLRRNMWATAPGTTVTLTVMRNKKSIQVPVTIEEAKAEEEEAEKPTEDKLGVSVVPLTKDMADEIGVPSDIKGVVVRKVSPDGPASRAGLREKDVIMEIDNVPVDSVAAFTKATASLKSGETAIVVVQRGERSVILEMAID